MATTTVAKGANRASASARTRKAAQRTALPPRAGQVDAAKAPVAPVAASPLEPKGSAKAARFAADLAPYGWATEVTGGADGAVTATATRGPETIMIRWDTGVFNYEESRHAVGDRTVRPRNVSAARAIAARPTGAAEAELTRVVANRWRKKASQPDRAKALPFDPGTALDAEVLSTLAGRKVTWYNRLTSSTETAVVPASSPFTKITETAESGRVLLFCSPGSGFRAFRLEAVLSVRRR